MKCVKHVVVLNADKIKLIKYKAHVNVPFFVYNKIICSNMKGEWKNKVQEIQSGMMEKLKFKMLSAC